VEVNPWVIWWADCGVSRRGQQVSDTEGRALADRLECRLIETSARTSSNVRLLFETVLTEIERDSGLLDSEPAPPAKPPSMCVVL
jgi:hypothetical protein